MRPDQYAQIAQALPGDIRPDNETRAGHAIEKMKAVIGDKSGLGSIAAIGTMGLLAYMAAKSKQNRLIQEALRKKIPVIRDLVTPVVAFTGGGAAALAGKHLVDKYNNRDMY